MTLSIKKKLSDNLDLQPLRMAIEEETGLILSHKKDREILSRIGTDIEKYESLSSFIETFLRNKKIAEKTIDKLTIGESYFFRNHPHFSALREFIIPSLIKKNKESKHLKIWSAGCSSGEEPYSLAIMIDNYFPQLKDWKIEIHATDINTAFLKKARKGQYTSWSFRGVENSIIEKYFTRIHNNLFELNSDIKKVVTFSTINLSKLPLLPVNEHKDSDLILCRNVLIYFAIPMATQICQSFSEHLNDDSFLILGHSESFPKINNMKTVYSHATYYYQKTVEKQQPNFETSRISLVPGIGQNASVSSLTPNILKNFSSKKADEKKNKISQIINKATDPEVKESDKDTVYNEVYNLTIDGHFETAMNMIDDMKKQSVHPDYRLFFLSALIFDQKNNIEETLKNLKQSIFINKNFIIGHYYQAVVYERRDEKILAQRELKNSSKLLNDLPGTTILPWGGGITAARLLEIVTERQKELEFVNNG
ncbi:MAG: protein-glutamate O-methyltransferase CheR [Deltaproteobacteria bacterium]|nr:protein-glutamate O-methyltransferase CheR [Deltaproteobacteria bacterium]